MSREVLAVAYEMFSGGMVSFLCSVKVAYKALKNSSLALKVLCKGNCTNLTELHELYRILIKQ